MSDSVGKVSLDLEVQSDLNGQINGMAQKIGKEFEKAMKSASGSLDPEAFTKGLTEELEKAMQGISQAINAVFQKSAEAAKSSIDSIGQYLNTMIDRAMKRITDVAMSFGGSDSAATPEQARPDTAQPRAPPGVRVKIPTLKVDLSKEMIQAQMEQLEQLMQNVGKEVDVLQARLDNLKSQKVTPDLSSYESLKKELEACRASKERLYDPAIIEREVTLMKQLQEMEAAVGAGQDGKLEEQIIKTERAIISLMGKMSDLGIQYDALERKVEALAAATKAVTGTFGGIQVKVPKVNAAPKATGLTDMSGTIDAMKIRSMASVEQINQAFSLIGTGHALNGIRTAQSGLSRLFNLIGSGVSRIAKTGMQLKLFGGQLKKTGKQASSAESGIHRMLTTMLRYQIIIPMIMSALRGMVSFLMGSLKANQQFSNSLKQIQSNLNVAFTPIYQAILPAINALMAALARLSAYFASFISAIFGKSLSASVAATKSLVKAKSAMGAYGGAAGKTAKELKATLGPMDEINRLNDQADDGGGGGGGGAPEIIEPPDMSGIDAAVMPWVEKFKSIMSRLFQPFQEAWAAEGQNTINAMKAALGNIWQLVKDIGSSFLNVWTNGTGTQVLTTILQIFQNIFNVIGNIAGRLDEAWNTNGNGTRIIQGLLDLLQAVLDTVWKITDATARWAAKVDFEPLLKGVGDVIQSMEPVVRAIGDTIADLWQTIVLPFLSWLIESAIPKVLEILSGVFNFLGEHKGIVEVLTVLVLGFVAAFKTIGTIFGIVEAVIGIVTTLAGVFHTIGVGAGAVAAAIGGISAPVAIVIGVIAALVAGGILLYKNWDTIKAKAAEIWTAVKATFEGFSQFLTGIFTTDWSRAFGIFGDCLNGFLVTVNGVWESAKTIFDGIITFVSGVFSGNWRQAWDGVVQIFTGIMQGLSAAMKAPLNAVIGLINGAISALNQIHIDIPDWIPGLGGKSFGVDIPKIPYLATGGIVTQPTLAMMGEGGKKEAVVPLDRNLGWRDAIVEKINEELDHGGKGDPGFTLDELMTRLRSVIMEAAKLFAGLVPQAPQYNADTGDIIIPIYLDNNMLDEVIITAQQRKALRSGGR